MFVVLEEGAEVLSELSRDGVFEFWNVLHPSSNVGCDISLVPQAPTLSNNS